MKAQIQALWSFFAHLFFVRTILWDCDLVWITFVHVHVLRFNAGYVKLSTRFPLHQSDAL